MRWKNKRVLIMGLGLHGGGVGAAKFFVRQGAKVLVTDLKTRKQLAPSLKKLRGLKIAYVLGRHRKEDFIRADLIIQNPGVPADSPYLKIARRRGVPIDTDIGIFFETVPRERIIGVTGTKGKSTTAALIAAMLKQKFPRTILAGNIRASVLDFLHPSSGISNLYYAHDREHSTSFEKWKKLQQKGWGGAPIVLELSSWQIEGFAPRKINPRVAVVTNVLRDHLNRYSSFRAYAEAKRHLVRWQKAGDIAVLNKDSTLVRSFARGLRSRVAWFSCRAVPKKYRLALRLAGAHNLANLAAALAVAKIYKVPDRKIMRALKNFKCLEGRLEFIGEKRGVKFYNDTTATSPDATIAALKSFPDPQKIILICGGADKKLDFRPLAKFLKSHPTKAAILLPGTATTKLVRALSMLGHRKTVGLERTVKLAKNMREAVRQAWRVAQKGDIILLSPGAASFGLFAHEFDRGEQFAVAVKKLK